MHGGRRSEVLSKRQIGKRLRVFSNVIQDGIAHDTDDFTQLGLSEEVETLSDGVLTRPELIGHRFVDDSDWIRILAVGVGEIAAFKERNA